jgi:hypothetical protein
VTTAKDGNTGHADLVHCKLFYSLIVCPFRIGSVPDRPVSEVSPLLTASVSDWLRFDPGSWWE